ncbi:hypothetical protein BsWGS_08710 [Bradybaena similaris]
MTAKIGLVLLVLCGMISAALARNLTENANMIPCTYGKNTYEHGTKFLLDGRTCSCNYGLIINCQQATTLPPLLTNSRDCVFKGETRRHGKFFTFKNKTCSCYEKLINCEWIILQ